MLLNTDAFYEALADRLTPEDLITYLNLSSADLVKAFRSRVQKRANELADEIGWKDLE